MTSISRKLVLKRAVIILGFFAFVTVASAEKIKGYRGSFHSILSVLHAMNDAGPSNGEEIGCLYQSPQTWMAASNSLRCGTVIGNRKRVKGFFVAIEQTTDLGDCNISLVIEGVEQAWSIVEVGVSNVVPSCSDDNLTGKLIAQGEYCYRKAPLSTYINQGEYYQYRNSNGTTGTCDGSVMLIVGADLEGITD